MASDEPFSALDAAAAIHTAESTSLMLKRRTTGLMWMLWGLVVPGIFMTFGYAAAHADHQSWWLPLLWMPWAAAGLVTTALLWRSMRLAMPNATQRPRSEIFWHVALFLFVVVGGAWSVILFHAPIYPPVVAMTGLGVVSMIFGITGILTIDKQERRVRFLTGALIVLVAAATALTHAALTSVFLVGAITVGVTFYASGLWLVLRG